MSPVRLKRDEEVNTGSDPHLVERVQGINVETGHLHVGDSGRKFYASKRPTETLCYIAGQDFELPEDCQSVGEVGIAIIGDTCTMYGVIQMAGDASTPGDFGEVSSMELVLPMEAVPMFEVYRTVLVGYSDNSGEYIEPGILIINPETGNLSVKREQTGLIRGYQIHFGQLQYIKK